MQQSARNSELLSGVSVSTGSARQLVISHQEQAQIFAPTHSCQHLAASWPYGIMHSGTLHSWVMLTATQRQPGLT